MSRPVALLTDFGLLDAYAGIVKGVLLARCPDVRVFDLTHGIPPQDVLAGALQLAAAAPYCPEETVFLAVVDPGVGSTRRPLCMRAGRQLFVGPDNGLLWLAASGGVPRAPSGWRRVPGRPEERVREPECFHLDRPERWLPEPGGTFHGRDIFAPVAALLAAGGEPEDAGSPVTDPVRLALPEPDLRPDGATGEVILIDHYGNAVTNLRPDHLGHPAPGTITFRVGWAVLTGPATHYAAVPPGERLVLAGSLGFYEVAVSGGSAATALGLRRGSRVTAFPAAAP